MNELFFSALFIGSLLFGNSEINENPSELNSNQTAYTATKAKGKIELIADDSEKFQYKVIGDPVIAPLAIIVNDEIQGEVKVGEVFEVLKSSSNKEVDNLEVILENAETEYASYVISF